jgi:hypothetical protein
VFGVLARLVFRNVDGSLALGGWWVVVLAVVGIGGQAMMLVVNPGLYLRVFTRGTDHWVNRIPAPVFRAWGLFCLVLALSAVVWVLNTTPGKLY